VKPFGTSALYPADPSGVRTLSPRPSRARSGWNIKTLYWSEAPATNRRGLRLLRARHAALSHFTILHRSIACLDSATSSEGDILKMVTEYLVRAIEFERMASEETDSTFKDQLLKQAAAYRKLAKERAEKSNLPLPPNPEP